MRCKLWSCCKEVIIFAKCPVSSILVNVSKNWTFFMISIISVILFIFVYWSAFKVEFLFCRSSQCLGFLQSEPFMSIKGLRYLKEKKVSSNSIVMWLGCCHLNLLSNIDSSKFSELTFLHENNCGRIGYAVVIFNLPKGAHSFCVLFPWLSVLNYSYWLVFSFPTFFVL